MRLSLVSPLDCPPENISQMVAGYLALVVVLLLSCLFCFVDINIQPISLFVNNFSEIFLFIFELSEFYGII